jgi:ribosomal protein L24
MAQAKAKSIKKGDQVKVIAGEHEGKTGTLKHIRQATGQAHVDQDGDRVIVVKADELAAA